LSTLNGAISNCSRWTSPKEFSAHACRSRIRALRADRAGAKLAKERGPESTNGLRRFTPVSQMRNSAMTI